MCDSGGKWVNGVFLNVCLLKMAVDSISFWFNQACCILNGWEENVTSYLLIGIRITWFIMCCACFHFRLVMLVTTNNQSNHISPCFLIFIEYFQNRLHVDLNRQMKNFYPPCLNLVYIISFPLSFPHCCISKLFCFIPHWLTKHCCWNGLYFHTISYLFCCSSAVGNLCLQRCSTHTSTAALPTSAVAFDCAVHTRALLVTDLLLNTWCLKKIHRKEGLSAEKKTCWICLITHLDHSKGAEVRPLDTDRVDWKKPWIWAPVHNRPQ